MPQMSTETRIKLISPTTDITMMSAICLHPEAHSSPVSRFVLRLEVDLVGFGDEGGIPVLVCAVILIFPPVVSIKI
jgi:hypothetical protein